jgi:C4-dicarboxylate-specific signal transduction histidine kinase
MSKTIAQEHCGGELMVSNEDDGAIFTIKLKRNHE